MTLSFAGLLYGSFITISRRLVPAVGGGSGPGSAQGFGAAGLSLGHPGISGFLQTVAAAGHGGVGPEVHGTSRGAAAFGRVATGGMESGVELVFPAGKSIALQIPRLAHTSQRATPCVRDKEPPLAATDLGGPEWEQKLIRELRSRHYEWRTEQAYRMWAGRFAEWLEKRRGMSVLAAGEIELRDFLSDLATRQRVAVATQRQALNAVVFLVREALGRSLADFGDFTRAPGGKAGAGGVVAGGMPAVAGRAGGHDAVDGGVDVWERVAVDGVVAVADQGCGCGAAAVDCAGGQRRQGPGDGGAGGVGGAVAGAS